jgi:uncharacterized protein YqhQ
MIKSAILKVLFLPLSLIFAARKNTVGGQAIIEGVMMRGKDKVSWAVRRGPSEVMVEQFPFTSVCKKHKVLSRPVLRGAINLLESLSLGYKALSRSAEIAEQTQENKNSGTERNPVFEKIYSWISFIVALAISIGVFMYGPMWVISQFIPKESAFLFNTLAGIVRIILFIGYLVLISMWKEIQRVFEYHGAEHKAIFTFEDGKELNFENMNPYTTVHPRCGTSFILLVGLVCIFLFSIIDALYIAWLGPFPNVLVRLLVHLSLIPLVGGMSYEVLKLSDKYKNAPVVGLLIKPGLWLQKITTRNPDEHQLEVASLALKAVI